MTVTPTNLDALVDGDEIVGIVSIRDLYAATKKQLEEDIRQRESFIFDTGYGAGD